MTLSQRLVDGIDRLDPLPVTVHRLMGMLGDESVSPREIASVVEYDQAIAATLLKVANSPVMGARMRVTRVADAVLRMGVDQVLDIALGSRLRTLSGRAELYDLTEDELWLHGAVSSVAAREIAAACTAVEVPRVASIAALTHDIGKLVIVRHVDADMGEVLRLAAEEGLTFVEAERALFGFDHAEVGAAMADRWGFPEEIRDAIARHHTVPVDDPTPVLDAVVLANVVAKTVGVGLGAEGLNLDMDPALPDRMGFGFPDFGRIVSRTATGMQELMGLYGIEAGIGRAELAG